jgi:pimeloyl-ACP methyl ester carboxylesterase
MSELDRDGVAISYLVHGTDTGRTPLLLTHGYSASAGMWKPNVDALSADRLVVTWDVRGHGESASPDEPTAYSQELSIGDMVAILDACGIERAAIGGLSLGGFLSLAFRLEHPDRTAALLLFDTGPGFNRDEPREQWNEMARGFAASFDERGLDALVASPEVAGGEHDPAGLAHAARGILTQHDNRVIASLAGIDVPTLVVVGEHDRQFLNAADYFAAKIPGAVKHVIANAGHASNIDQPAEFNRVVTAFLGRHSL